jgi:integrase
MSRQQQGYIWRVGKSWYGRWREDVLEDGRVVRKQRARKLVEYCDRYRTERDVQPLLDEILCPLNQGRSKPESTLTIAEYVEQYYLDFVRDNCKPSTYSGYKTQWQMYLVPRLSKFVLRDFRTSDAARLFDDIYHAHKLGRSTLRHLKSFLSGMFTFAINQGVLDGLNPIREARIPKKANGPAETHAASPDEVLAILNALQKAGKIKACAAVALMFFGGLRPGEARGVCWEDYDGRQITVRRSIWRTHATEPKTAESAKPVPIIEPLRSILAELREMEGSQLEGPILRGPKAGQPLNLDNLARREMRDILLKAGIEWHGWYSLRRGIATMIQTVEKDPMAAKGLLRHSSVITTQKHYIKDVPETTLNAMKKVEALCNHRANLQNVRPS